MAEHPHTVSARGNLAEGVIKRMCEVFRVVADPSRLKILLALAQNGAMNVSALADLLGQPQAAISGRLSVLRRVGLVDGNREGKRRHYCLGPTHASKMLQRLIEEIRSGAEPLNF